jgi:hypothetical protein
MDVLMDLLMDALMDVQMDSLTVLEFPEQMAVPSALQLE